MQKMKDKSTKKFNKSPKPNNLRKYEFKLNYMYLPITFFIINKYVKIYLNYLWT